MDRFLFCILKCRVRFFLCQKKILLAKYRIFSLRNTKSRGVTELFGKSVLKVWLLSSGENLVLSDFN